MEGQVAAGFPDVFEDVEDVAGEHYALEGFSRSVLVKIAEAAHRKVAGDGVGCVGAHQFFDHDAVGDELLYVPEPGSSIQASRRAFRRGFWTFLRCCLSRSFLVSCEIGIVKEGAEDAFIHDDISNDGTLPRRKQRRPSRPCRNLLWSVFRHNRASFLAF